MSEGIFKQASPDILRLYQQTVYSLLATQCCNDCEVHDVIYVTLDGRYYVWLPCMAEAKQSQTGTLLIEDEGGHAHLSWMASIGEVKQKDSLHDRVVPTLQHKTRQTKNKFNQTVNTYLLELTPQQGRLTTGSKDLSLSPYDLVKALYPATHQLGEFALQQFWQWSMFLLRPLKS